MGKFGRPPVWVVVNKPRALSQLAFRARESSFLPDALAGIIGTVSSAVRFRPTWAVGDYKGETMKVRSLMACLGVASIALMGAVATARADEWFVLGEKQIKSSDLGTEIKAEKGKIWKEDIKKAKISVEGADVELTKVILHWNNAKDDTIAGVGVLKAGGETAAHDAPTREGTLMSVTLQYKILNGAPTANVKVWGYD
jgi:hypothetical protein